MSKATGSRKRIFEALGLPESATEKQALAKVDRLLAVKARRESPTHVAARERVIGEAVRAGKIARPHVWRARYDADPQGTTRELAQLTAIDLYAEKTPAQVEEEQHVALMAQVYGIDVDDVRRVRAQVETGLRAAGVGPERRS